MKISESWLKELAKTTLTTDELVHQLTMAGLEVDGVEAIAGDAIMDIDLTPNRADCLSMQGIARELKAIVNAKFTPVKINTQQATIKDSVSVKLLAPQACSHYVGRAIKNINQQAKTPDWMLKRLNACGLSPISPVVDVTNYVMLELGQPMHAFDLSKIQGEIVVRWARAKEKIQLIDDEDSVVLNEADLLIADKASALAIAGIKGGEFSKVTQNTRDIFLESAYFNPSHIAVSARKLGVHTDSAYRFSRGVDPQLQVDAIERATELLLAIAGGDVGPIIEVSDKKHLPNAAVIHFRPSRIEQLLGVRFSEKQIQAILENLGMQVKTGKVWQVTAPTYRFDIVIEEDLIEEIARVVGYDQLPAKLPEKLGLNALPSEAEVSINDVRMQLVARGYQEVMTYSFISEFEQQCFVPESDALTFKLQNPVSAEMSEMRKSIWPSLVKSLQYNLNRQVERVRIFEMGTAFLKEELPVLSGLAFGQELSEQWRGEKTMIDFYSVKADLEALQDFEFIADEHVALHPGQTAAICYAGEKVGYLGALHPDIAQTWKLPEGIILFELNLKSLLQSHVSKYKNLSKFPSIRRDLAFIVDNSVEYKSLLATIKRVVGELLIDVQLFDVYQGKGIKLGQKSVAFGLILQDFSRTLREEEVTALLTKLVNAVQDEHGATLRK